MGSTAGSVMAVSIAGSSLAVDPTASKSSAAAAAAKAAAGVSSAGGIEAGTPRSILKRSSSVGTAATAGALGAVHSSSCIGSKSGGTPRKDAQQQQHARFDRSVSGELTDSDDGSSSDGSSDEELSEAEQRLQGVLRRYDHVLLDNRLHQVRCMYSTSGLMLALPGILSSTVSTCCSVLTPCSCMLVHACIYSPQKPLLSTV
jgi:hypothetical protein